MGLHHSPRIVTDGLVLCLDAADKNSYPGSGTTWTDLSGQGNNGTLQNGPTFITENGGGFSFDGTNDYASTTVLSLSSPSAITVECMVKFRGTLDSNDRKIMHYDKTGTNNAVFQLRKGDTNSRLMYQHHDGTSWHTLSDDDAIESDTWTHFLVTHSGTTGVMYKNGAQSANATISTLDWTNANNVIIGWRASDEYWKGDIAFLKLYTRALTATEIQQNYNATKTRFGL
jgi:hypothetical protein